MGKKQNASSVESRKKKRNSFAHRRKLNPRQEKVCVWHWTVWNELTDNEQIAEWARSVSLAYTARCVSMTLYMSCWHNALYISETASSVVLCTVCSLGLRYAQLTNWWVSERLGSVKTANTFYWLSTDKLSALFIWFFFYILSVFPPFVTQTTFTPLLEQCSEKAADIKLTVFLR